MARKRYDYDDDGDDYCGIVGGEMTSGGCCDPDGYDPDFGSVKDICDRVKGSEYDYLGHFRQERFLSQGHNDMALTEPGLPPLDVPSSDAASRPQPLPQRKPGSLGGLLGLLGGSSGTGGLY